MVEPEIVEDFFGVYLLFCVNPKFRGRTYVGYTRDPNRRIKQHNRGTWAGGAYRTSNKGPWKMALIIHGFPNNISALRFEWAWQNPTTTTRLQHLNLMRVSRKESEFQFKLRILSEMLRVGPWCRLPLVIRWLDEEYYQDFPIEKKPPDHITICHGPVKSRNLKKTEHCDSNFTRVECLICSQDITDANTKLNCLNSDCELVSHITCLAKLFITPGDFIPVEGTCPFCDTSLKWGDLVRQMKGCSKKGETVTENGESEAGNDDLSDEDDEIISQGKEFVDNNSRWILDSNDDLFDQLK